MAKYQVTMQYSINEVVEVEAGSAKEAIEKVYDGEYYPNLPELPPEVEFRDWLPRENWPVYNVDEDKQEN